MEKNYGIYQNNENPSLKNKEMEPFELVHMSIYQINTYRKDISMMSQVLRDAASEKLTVLHIATFTALKPTSNFLPQSGASYRSDSSPEANSSCCHRSDARSHLL